MLEDLKNNIDFFIRSKTGFSRKNFIEKNPYLIERNKAENLYTKDILTQFLTKPSKENIKILDIGCKNWFYAKGEYDFFTEYSKNIQLEGVEIDAFRLYANLYTRFEVAKYYTKELKNTHYIADNLLNIKEQYDYIIWFLPFVLLAPHKYWGLPKKYFYPETLLKHAYSILKNNGEMLIINQGEIEETIQKELLDKLKIKYFQLGEVTSSYLEYKHKRFGFLIKKTSNDALSQRA